MALTNDEKRILAQTLLGEAGGEGMDGMIAVAHAIKNRAGSGRYPSDPVSVALQPKQFSTWNSGEGGNNPGRFGPGSPGYSEALKAVEAVFEGNAPDPTGGATHYWSPKGMRAMGYASDPYWAKSEESEFGRLSIGNHVFLPRQAPNSALGAIQNATAPIPAPAPNRQVPQPPYPMPAPNRGGASPDPRQSAMNMLTEQLLGRNNIVQEDLSGFANLFPPKAPPMPMARPIDLGFRRRYGDINDRLSAWAFQPRPPMPAPRPTMNRSGTPAPRPVPMPASVAAQRPINLVPQSSGGSSSPSPVYVSRSSGQQVSPQQVQSYDPTQDRYVTRTVYR